MDQAFQQVGIEWERWGYANSPGPAPVARLPSVIDAWDLWATVLRDAKAGTFRDVPQLLDLFRKAPHPVLTYLCVQLLGDAGTPQCYEVIGRQLPAVAYPEAAQHHVDILAARGWLADVPLLVQTYERFAASSDGVFIAYSLAEMLSADFDFVYAPESFAAPAEYAAAVLGRYREIAETLGGEQHYVFQGVKFSVAAVAQGLIDAVSGQDFIPNVWRRKFEASTGVDCSTFYRESHFQPLTAAAIAEDFLNSPAVERFAAGVRYFFGHRLPD